MVNDYIKKRSVISLICLFSFGCETEPKTKGIATAERVVTKNESTSSYSKRQLAKISRTEHINWFSGGTLHKSKMREWSRATYDNKLATAADLVMGCLKIDGVDVMKIDIERELKPMAIDFAKGLDNANADGLADNMDVSEVAATIWIIMKSGN